ncbi:MAG: hypothetical protein ACOCUV_02315 [bacterium]
MEIIAKIIESVFKCICRIYPHNKAGKVKQDSNVKRTIALTSLVITCFLLISIILMGAILNKEREQYLDSQFQDIHNEFNNMETLSLMAESYDNKMACLAFEKLLKDLDGSIWKLGEKLEKYKSASEEFYKDEYYQRQKKIFNENQVYYYLLMKRMVERCNISKKTVLFFYQNSADCKKCDDQSFILSDINKLDDDKGEQEIAIFSLDMDLNISSTKILTRYYDINEYPCVVIGEDKYCGIRGEKFIMEKICEDTQDLHICELYESKK